MWPMKYKILTLPAEDASQEMLSMYYRKNLTMTILRKLIVEILRSKLLYVLKRRMNTKDI